MNNFFYFLKSIESEKWKLSHENLDLKHDIDSLISFINTAKRTGKWDTKKLQLKFVPLDRIIGISNDETDSTIPLHKEIQYRDERILNLQAEIEQLRKTQNELAKQVEILFCSYLNKFCFFLRHRINTRVFRHLWVKMN
jgi:hypothetical protein